MNVQTNAHWAAFKAHLVRTIGHDEAGNWLRYAASVMDIEAKRKRLTIEGEAKAVRQ